MPYPIIQKSLAIKLVKAILLNTPSMNSIGLKDGKLGLSLTLFEVAHYFKDPLIEEKALKVLQEVLALRQKGQKIKPIEIGFTLLYLIDNKIIEANFDELFGEDTEGLINSIRFFSPYSELHLFFVPFLSLLWNHKNEETIRQLTLDLLDGVTLSLENQFYEIQKKRFLTGIQKWERSFASYLKALTLVKDYKFPSKIVESYVTFYQKGRIINFFDTGFYLEKLAIKDQELSSLGKKIQENAIQNIRPDLLTLSQQIKLSYLLRQAKHLPRQQIQQLEMNFMDCKNLMYAQKLAAMVPFNQSIIGYESGIARLLLYCVYLETLHMKQDCTRFQYIFA